MKKTVVCCLLVLITLCFATTGRAANVASVEVLYMNHGPMQPVVKQLKETFSKYAGKIRVAWYDLDTGDGQKFMTGKGLREHVPVMVWIDGSCTLNLPRGTVRFAGFPSGYGPEQFQGGWTIKDLETALDQGTARK